MDHATQRDHVSKYYGQILKTSADLRTSACCPVDAVPPSHRPIISLLHPEVTSRFYGCGSPIPSHLEGTQVLDLGCGTGRDVYLAAALVGPEGKVVGIDMTESQLEVARKYEQYHSNAFFNDPTVKNVEFRNGQIEDLSSAGLIAHSFDIVISNCVCNLSPEKTKVFSEVFRMLKTGGEFYFSDVYADRRLSEEAQTNPVLIGECLGGAMYFEDFRRVMADVGFKDVRIMSCTPVYVTDESLLHMVEDVSFFSVTVRVFKLGDSAEDRREDYSQTAVYIPQEDGIDDVKRHEVFTLDIDNKFESHVPSSVDSNTASILEQSRFRNMFKVSKPMAHKGLFYRRFDSISLPACTDGFRPPPAPVSPVARRVTAPQCCTANFANGKDGKPKTSLSTITEGCCEPTENLVPSAPAKASGGGGAPKSCGGAPVVPETPLKTACGPEKKSSCS